MKTLLINLRKLSEKLIEEKDYYDLSPSTIVNILRYRKRMEIHIIACITNTSTNPGPQIRFYSHSLIEISNRIYRSFTPRQKSRALSITQYSFAGALSEILQAVDAVLILIKDFGKAYFDDSLKIPDYLLESNAKMLVLKFETAGAALKKQGLPDVLYQILFDYFNGFSSGEGKTFSFRNLRYARKLLRGLQHTRPHEDPACMISGLLVYLNFNKVSLLDFCKDWMKTVVDQAESAEQLYDKLSELKKQVYVQEENKYWGYDHEHISLKDHLLVLLDAEMIHLENLKEKQQQQDALQNHEYFIMDTTVKQLDLWADISVKLKIIPSHSALHVIKVLTKYVRTPKSGIIPYDSARKKLGEIDDATVIGLHHILSLQVNHLQKEYPHLF